MWILKIFSYLKKLRLKILYVLNLIFIFLIYLKINNKENLCENIYLSNTIPNVTVQYCLIISILLLLGLLIYKIHSTFSLFFNMYLARYFYKSLFIEISKFDCLGFRSKTKFDIGQILVEKNKVNKISEVPGLEMGMEVKTSTGGWFDFLNNIDYIYWGKVALVLAASIIAGYTIYKLLSGGNNINDNNINNINDNNISVNIKDDSTSNSDSEDFMTQIFTKPDIVNDNILLKAQITKEIDKFHIDRLSKNNIKQDIENGELTIDEAPYVYRNVSKIVKASYYDRPEAELNYPSDSEKSQVSDFVENHAKCDKIESECITVCSNPQKYYQENGLLDNYNAINNNKLNLGSDIESVNASVNRFVSFYSNMVQILKTDPNIKDLYPLDRARFISKIVRNNDVLLAIIGRLKELDVAEFSDTVAIVMEAQNLFNNHAEKFEKKFGPVLSYDNSLTWQRIKNSK